jgi:flagellar biosynthetic protein FlhB
MSQKTERATPKRRREAREKGNVLKSADVSTAAVLLAVFAGVKIFGGSVVEGAADMMQWWLTFRPSGAALAAGEAAGILSQGIVTIARIGAPLVGIGLVMAVAANVMQVGFLFTPKALQPKMNRINPAEGFKRIFSVRSLAELLKALIKILALGYVAYGEYKAIIGSFANRL